MKRIAVILALLCIPATLALSLPKRADAGCYRWRGGVPFWYSNGCYTRARYYPGYAVAPTQSAGQLIAGLAARKAEWQFVSESIAQLFPGSTGAAYQSSQYAVQRGATVYGANNGYSLQSFATVTPQALDVEALMERATRLATQAQSHGADATAQAQGLLGQAQAGQQAIAQTFAQAARELSVLQALQPIAPQEVKTETSYQGSTSLTPGASASSPSAALGTGGAEPVATGRAVSLPKFQAIVTVNCAACHDAESPAGGFNLAGDVAALDKEQLTKMLARVTSQDESNRMPKDHPALSDADQMEFVKAWSSK